MHKVSYSKKLTRKKQMIILNCKKHDSFEKFKASKDTCKILCTDDYKDDYKVCVNEYCKYYSIP